MTTTEMQLEFHEVLEDGVVNINGMSLDMQNNAIPVETAVDPFGPIKIGETKGIKSMSLDQAKSLLPSHELLHPQRGILTSSLLYGEYGLRRPNNLVETKIIESEMIGGQVTKRMAYWRCLLEAGVDLRLYGMMLILDNSPHFGHCTMVRTRDTAPFHRLLPSRMEVEGPFLPQEAVDAIEDGGNIDQVLREIAFAPGSDVEPDAFTARVFGEMQPTFPKLASQFVVHDIVMESIAELQPPKQFTSKQHRAFYNAGKSLSQEVTYYDALAFRLINMVEDLCTANVDISDQIGQDIGICSDENVTLLADVNTLDFGEGVGDNPLIGWAIFTDLPDGNNPFEDPNYTGSIIAGNATTTGITINGTNDGFDPYGFNLNVLSFVPITFINYDPDADPALSLDSNCFDWGEFVTVSFFADGFGDCPLPCDANVEMADGVALVETLCIDETHELRVNTATLDFGVDEGDNPKVGWAISTADPGEDSPFGQDGFSGSAIPGGSGDDNPITVTGTADGLDPYGLGVAAIWLTPITFTNYDAMNNDFTLDNDCFDWGENVRITFVAEGEGDCNPVPQCPTTVNDFSANRSLCDGGTPTVPSDETILNSLDDANNAVINWSIDPNSPLTYSGNGCEVQTVEFTLTITCSEDETVSIEAGTFSISLYPTPQAPTVVFSNAEICSYMVLPNCPNDVVSPTEISDQAPGSMGITQDFTVSNGGCSALSFEGVAVPDCPEIAPQCPKTVDDFSGSESICDVGIPNVPTDEAILASMDDSMKAIIEWSIDPSVETSSSSETRKV